MEGTSDGVVVAREEELKLKLPALGVDNQETFGRRHC